MDQRDKAAIDQEWFKTVGQMHLDRFMGMVETAIRIAQENRIDLRTIDVNDLFRVYRGDIPKLTESQEEEIRRLYNNGMRVMDLARRYGVDWAQIKRIVRKEA